jgi:3D (Asp-Asp-Asp) domain-containing protein
LTSGASPRALAAARCLLGCIAIGACSTAGSTWVAEPLHSPDDEDAPVAFIPPPKTAPEGPARRPPAHRILSEDPLAAQKAAVARDAASLGRRAGVFRNTYYDFPIENHYVGESVSLFDAGCGVISRVPQGFHDAVCVQGSGLLANGRTVSFARRDCSCARRCPRTDQQICFEALDIKAYPWGRGATGKPVVPLLTVAVDTSVIPLGTPIFVPEYLGLPRDLARTSNHDGCFIAQDRGVKVKGQHIDVFTGEEAVTRLWNELVPSNKGVTVILESPFCARAD